MPPTARASRTGRRTADPGYQLHDHRGRSRSSSAPAPVGFGASPGPLTMPTVCGISAARSEDGQSPSGARSVPALETWTVILVDRATALFLLSRVRLKSTVCNLLFWSGNTYSAGCRVLWWLPALSAGVWHTRDQASIMYGLSRHIIGSQHLFGCTRYQDGSGISWGHQKHEDIASRFVSLLSVRETTTLGPRPAAERT